MRFYQQATLCFVTSRKKMQSILICRSDCDANNIFVWVEECGLMPSPQPSPTGRGRKRSVRFDALTPTLSHGEREKTVCAVWCPHPGPLPQGEGENGLCGLVPSPRPSPTGRGRKRSVRSGALTPALSHREREKRVCAVWCPHPGPLPQGEGENGLCGLEPSPRPSPTGRGRRGGLEGEDNVICAGNLSERYSPYTDNVGILPTDGGWSGWSRHPLASWC